MTSRNRMLGCWVAVGVLWGAVGGVVAAGPDSFVLSRPNILFAVADDWSYGHAGAYGCRWVQTPAFDRVAREGLLFTRAYTPNAKCAPSRACLLTGRNPWQLGAGANHVPFFPPEFKTFFETLGERGYVVGHTAKGWAPGVATNAAGAQRAMTGRAFNERQAKPPTSGIGNNDYAANFRDFLESAPAGSPWCFWYGGLEPHRGYEFGSGSRLGGKRVADVDRVPGFWPDVEVVRQDLLDYALEVEHFDRHLGRMLDLLRDRGMLENTLVVVTSDNGMPFPRAKGQMYETSHHLPLAMMWPAGIRRPGRRVAEPVSLIDLAPTVVELAGLRWSETGMAAAAGQSLAGLLRHAGTGAPPWERRRVLLGKERHDVGRPHDWGYPMRGVVEGDWLYVCNFEPARWPAGNPETGYLNCDGSPTKTEILRLRRSGGERRWWDLCFGKRPGEELYALRTDPDCLDNLAALPEHAEVRQRLRAALFEALRTEEDPRMFGRGAEFELHPYAGAGERQFHERWLRGEKLRAGWVNETDFEPGPLEE